MPRFQLVTAIMCMFSKAGLHKLLNSFCTKSHSSTNIGDCQEVLLKETFPLIFRNHFPATHVQIFGFKMEIFTCRCEQHCYAIVHDTFLKLIQNIYRMHNKIL